MEYHAYNDVDEWSFSEGLCGGNFTAPNGVLTSPSYPDKYPKNSDCIYTITQPNGTLIEMNVLTFVVENWGNEEGDYLEIRDGTSYQSPLLKKILHEHPEPIRSTKSSLWLR